MGFLVAITSSLDYDLDERGVELRVSGQPVARVDVLDGRVRVALALFAGERFVDVTPQPRTIGTLLRREARRRREDPNRWCAGVARRLHDDAGDRGVGPFPASDRVDLDALLASAAFPLARRARCAGTGPLPFAPRWAMPALLAGSPREAARAVFGAAASRSMARALPEGMQPADGSPPDAAPDLRPLGLALSLRDQVATDHLATVLAGSGRWLPPQHWPADEEVAALGRLWKGADPDTAVRLAGDALRHDHGIARLRRALELLEPRSRVGEMVVPRTLAALEDAAAPAGPPAPARHRPRRAPRPQLPARPRYAPAVPATAALADRFTYPPAIEVADGFQRGDFRLVLPRTASDLRAWARRLSNCVADYHRAVAAGASIVIGVEQRGTIAAALELEPDGGVRQFTGIGNCRPRPDQRAAVAAMLAELGLGAA